jgi:hypothetical protein
LKIKEESFKIKGNLKGIKRKIKIKRNLLISSLILFFVHAYCSTYITGCDNTSEEGYLFVTNIFVEVTMGLMLSCALLITAVQLVTDPIICDVKVKISIFICIFM